MAISDSYATAAEYRTVTGKTDTGSDTQILTDLTAISRYLEGKLGRFFNKDAADVTRLFLPEVSSNSLPIGDLSAAPATVKIDEDNDGSFADETALAATDYELHPLNAPLEPEAQPYTSLWIPPWSTKGKWPANVRVQVVGKFGWPAVPGAIKAATIQITAIYRLESPRATSSISELDGTIQASSQAQSIINKLTDRYQVHYFV